MLGCIEEDAIAAMEALKAAQRSPTPETIPDTTSIANSDVGQDTSFAGNTTTNTAASSNTQPKSILKKKPTGRPAKLTAKEKRERGLAIDKIVSALPLEFRGNDPNLRRNVEQVIEGLLDRQGRGVGRAYFAFLVYFFGSHAEVVLELVKPPDLAQARVNKCLIALVNRKVVRKDNSTVCNLCFRFSGTFSFYLQGSVLYHWQGLPE